MSRQIPKIWPAYLNIDMITQHNFQNTFKKELQNGHQHVQIGSKWTYTSTRKLDKGKIKYLFYPTIAIENTICT